MTVLNFLDCESGCTFSYAVDKAPGDVFVSDFCKRLEFCGRKRVVLRSDNEHSPKYDSASVGVIVVATRLVEGQGKYWGRLEQVLKIEINITDPIGHGSFDTHLGCWTSTESSSTVVRLAAGKCQAPT